MPPESVPSATRSSISLGGEAGEQFAVLVEHAGGVGEQDQFFGLEDLGQLAGDHIGVDVVGLALAADADRRDDGYEVAESRKEIRLGSIAVMSPTWPMSMELAGGPCPASAASWRG
jgi:hypothetical protein